MAQIAGTHPVDQFLAEATGTGPDRVKASALYEAWKNWTLSRYGQTTTQTAFGRLLTERGLLRKRYGTGYAYTGITLTVPADK